MNQVEYLINIQQQIWKPQGRSETRRRRVPAVRRVPSASTGRRLGPPLPRAAEAAPSHAAKRLRTHAR